MRKIKLTRGMVALVDEEFYPIISKLKWQATKGGKGFYATARSGKHAFKMHRIILGLKKGDGVCVDHINRDSLDNRASNLRTCTKGQNQFNIKKERKGTSQFKGVRLHRESGKWQAYIQCNYKWYHLGYYSTENLAAIAYNLKAEELFKQFAYLNEVTK